MTPRATIARLREVTRDDGYFYEFTWRGDRWAWQTALARLQEEIPRKHREFDGETKLWTVRVTADNVMSLSDIFPNFWAAIEAGRSQGKLFEEVGAGAKEAEK